MVKQKTIYIYKIYFPTSRKCYIGQTVNLNGRLNSHLNSKYLVGKAMRKYDDQQFSILHKIKSRKKANQFEITAIAAHNSIAPNGYNLIGGGEGLFNPSEETRKKMSRTKKGNQYLLGHHHTEETKKKIKTTLNRPEIKKKMAHKGNQYSLGYHHSEEARKKISENSAMNRLEVKEKRAASQMKMTIPEYRKLQTAKKAAKRKKLEERIKKCQNQLKELAA